MNTDERAPGARVLAYLESLARFGIKPGLGRVRALLRLLGNPHDSLRTIHVAGTNGKGSTAAMLAQILQQAGHRTGLYTQPHIRHYRERFLIDGRPMSPSELERRVRMLERILTQAPGRQDAPTQFEVEAALLYGYMAAESVDVLVQEVGMGGRWDTTNVVRKPLLTLITRIGYDHTEHLGRRLAAIAREKAGIIKPGVPLLTGVQRGPAWDIIQATARLRGAPLYALRSGSRHQTESGPGTGFFGYTLQDWNLDGGRFELEPPAGGIMGCRTPLLGSHQVFNAALAASGAWLLNRSGMEISGVAIRQGLAQTAWPGRGEVVSRDPWLILDGAHNPGGIRALRRLLDRLQPGAAWLFLFGALASKDAAAMLRLLLAPGDQVLLTRAPVPLAAEPQALAAAVTGMDVSCQLIEEPEAALAAALARRQEGLPLCICGSLYLLRRLRGQLDQRLQRGAAP